MKKEMKLLSIFLLSIIFISFFIGIVAAESILDKIKVGSFSAAWASLIAGTGFAQFLLFILVTFVVFAVMEFVPFVESKSWLAFGISVVIGLLSIYWLKSEEVYSILLSYSVLGIVITAIIPFLILAVLSKKLHDKGYGVFSKVLWIVLGVVLLMKYLTADLTQIGQFGKWAYPITLILVLIMLIWEKRLYLILFKKQIKEFKTQYNEEQIADLRGDLDRMGEAIKATTDPNVERTLVEKYNKKSAKLRAYGINWRDWGK